MKYNYRWAAVVLALASLLLQGCKESPAVAGGDETGPAKVEHLQGADPARITLTVEAAKRLDVQTDMVHEQQVDGVSRKVVAYAAVLYDTEGNTWMYVTSANLVFLRRHIVVDRVADDLAILSDGPLSGTAAVTVGAAELFGAETEFEEE